MTTSWSGQRNSFPSTIRRQILQRDPICRHCRRRPSTVADHIICHAEGGPDTLDNGQGLCQPCHDTKTRQEQARGKARHSPLRRPEPHPGLQ